MTPEDEAKAEYLNRIRLAREVLSQAGGWVRQLDSAEMRAFGVDVKPDVATAMDDLVTQLDEIIDLLNGDRMAEAHALYRYKYPKLKPYIDLGNRLWNIFHP
jgi:chromosome condensin MukBEF ATPase and DNA-binding subunit MukB